MVINRQMLQALIELANYIDHAIYGKGVCVVEVHWVVTPWTSLPILHVYVN